MLAEFRSYRCCCTTFAQQLGREEVFDLQKTLEQMLGSDVFISQAVCFLRRELQGALAVIAKWQLDIGGCRRQL